MKITKQQLKEIIKEETEHVLEETAYAKALSQLDSFDEGKK